MSSRITWGSLIVALLMNSGLALAQEANRGPAAVTGGNRLTQLWRFPVGSRQSTQLAPLPQGANPLINNLASREQFESLGQFQPRSSSRITMPPFVARNARFWYEP